MKVSQKYIQFFNTINDCISKIRIQFQESPHIFLTEADIKCYLYHLLAEKYANAEPAGETKVYEIRKNDKWIGTGKPYPKTKTFMLHSEIPYGNRSYDKRVDLCYAPLSTFKFHVVKRRSNQTMDTDEWRFDDGVGVEIKFNYKVKSNNKKHENFKSLKKSLKADINKLLHWDYGIFVFIDTHDVFSKSLLKDIKSDCQKTNLFYISRTHFFIL